MGSFKKGWRKLWKIMSFAKPFWKLFILATILAIIAVNIGLASPWLMKIFLDDVLIKQRFDLFYWLLGAFLFLWVFDQLFRFFQDIVSLRLGQKLDLHIKTSVFSHLLNLHIGFFHSKKVGDLMSRVSGDVGSIKSFVNMMVNTVFVQGFRMVIVLAIALTLSWQATVLTLIVFPFYLMSEKFFVKRLKAMEKVIVEKAADISSYLQESLSSIRAIKVFGSERATTEKYTGGVRELNRLSIRRSILSHISYFIRFFLTYIPAFLVLAVGGYYVMLGALTIGGLIALRSYIGQVFGGIETFFSLNRNAALLMVPINRVLEITEAEPKIKNVENPTPFKGVRNAIVFDDVDFSYNNKPVLKGINLEIKKGQRIGIAGPSGEGKSTLANLMIRFYDPTKGRIMIDDTDMRNFELISLREKIGFVSQESIIFNMSIRENIAFAKPDASNADIERAARLAEIHDFIMTLPNGYDTVVGERGGTLSGGQKQRLSIARVILRNPDIILLDEPTSSLDPETEKKIQRSLDLISKDKTTIVIAHRLSTLQNVDKLILLKDNTIVEEGTFLDLMKKKGAFFHYYNTQFRTYENFLSKLTSEIGRARKYGRTLNLATISFGLENVEPEMTKKIMENVELVLEKNIKGIYFFCVPPHSKHSIQIVLPEISKEEAENYMVELATLLKDKLKLEVKFSLINDIEKIETTTK